MLTAEGTVSVDLRGLTPDQVVQILRGYGFTIEDHRETDAHKQHSIFGKPTEEDMNRVVRMIVIKPEEATRLKVVIYNGEEKHLHPGLDLHFFEGSDGGWGVSNTEFHYK